MIGGAVLRGMADTCLTAIGVETSATAVARHYGARSGTGLGPPPATDGPLTVPEIAEHTRMTDYTTTRIADRVAERAA